MNAHEGSRVSAGRRDACVPSAAVQIFGAIDLLRHELPASRHPRLAAGVAFGRPSGRAPFVDAQANAIVWRAGGDAVDRGVDEPSESGGRGTLFLQA